VPFSTARGLRLQRMLDRTISHSRCVALGKRSYMHFNRSRVVSNKFPVVFPRRVSVSLGVGMTISNFAFSFPRSFRSAPG
jgi:hypothetical protein